MTRAEFERHEAAVRNSTVAAMRADGFWSARCLCDRDDCPGWQSVAVPPDATPAERAVALKEFRLLAPQAFGGKP